MKFEETESGLLKFTVEVEITQDDINHGKRACPRDCPAAIAIERAIPNSTYVAVGGKTAAIDLKDTPKGYKGFKAHSYELMRFVNNFDWPYLDGDSVPTKMSLTFIEII
jgi:hypothetical protein